METRNILHITSDQQNIILTDQQNSTWVILNLSWMERKSI